MAKSRIEVVRSGRSNRIAGPAARAEPMHADTARNTISTAGHGDIA